MIPFADLVGEGRVNEIEGGTRGMDQSPWFFQIILIKRKSKTFQRLHALVVFFFFLRGISTGSYLTIDTF